MKKILLLSLVLLSTQARASFYSELAQNFDSAQQPTQEQITGVWSGRCFSSEYDRTPSGIALVAETYQNPANGPLFSGKFDMGVYEDNDPAHFDDMSVVDITQLFKSDHGGEEVSVDQGSLVSIKREQYPSVYFYVRASGSYLFMKEVISARTSYCYFFNKFQ